MKTNPRYGWRPDLPDHRDRIFSVYQLSTGALPSSVDLRSACPPIIDQGNLGSCTACAIGSAHFFSQKKQLSTSPFLPSRLFIYYNERALEGSIPIDAGASLRDGMKTVNKKGACPEIVWPYDIKKFAVKPSHAAYVEARKHQTVIYQRVIQTLGQMKACLASGYPFVFGFSVFESFEAPAIESNGIVQMPSQGESMLGGHAVMAVGYDDAIRRFIIMNSWGKRWGMRGYFTMPYEYLQDNGLADDFWTITLVEVYP